MKISYNWLKTFVDIDHSLVEITDMLTDLGLEVAAVIPFESIPGSLRGLVVGKVKSVGQHPNADRLRCTRVNVGGGTELQIVCGAPDVAEGQTVAVAPPGSRLCDSAGKCFDVENRKLRGVLSEGMICAGDEIGLSASCDGILVLDDRYCAGTPLCDVFQPETDTTIEIELTPNRADAMSHWGVARDLNARFQLHGEKTQVRQPSIKAYRRDQDERPIKITVADAAPVPRYAGVTLSDLRVKPAPKWLQNRLKAIGLTPVNNVVDVTNYVLHGLGQPLHAYDYHAIGGGEIRVTNAVENTELVTLDGITRKLSAEDLLICDAKKPMGIAGVIGGWHSRVTTETTKIFLESAYFDPISIRKTARRHGLHTDASFRFERGIDPSQTLYALQYAALLLEETAGAQVAGTLCDYYPKPIPNHRVSISLSRIDQLFGEPIPRETIKRILCALEIKILTEGKDRLKLEVPAYRVDVTRAADVAEEILRVYGYNRISIPNTCHIALPHQRDNTAVRQERMAEQLAALGFQEMMAVSLTHSDYNAYSTALSKSGMITISNPLSRDLNSLRQTLIFGALEAVSRNIKHQNHHLKLFEFGKVYNRCKGTWTEEQRIGLTLCGQKTPESWYVKASPTDFFYLKGYLEVLLEKSGIAAVTYRYVKSDIFSEGLQLFTGEKAIGNMGVVRPSLCKKFDVAVPVFAAELNLEALRRNKSEMRFEPLPKYPAVCRDLALLLPDEAEFSAVEQIAFETERQRLRAVNLFDVYRGKGLPKGKKSYAVRFTFQDVRATLTDKRVDAIMAKLVQRYASKLHATLRS
ncbi:MAG: phenylalanine--tRNA ligase subunit beta [Flavobacteriales bacterium]